MSWEETKLAFDEALQLSPREWERFVASWAAGDAARERELLSLLQAYATSEGFLEQPVTVLPAAPPGRVPDFIGGYRILRRIGEGGMGEVYLAVREAEGFRHQVAIKVMKPGLEACSFRERFLEERRILALLDHPHIARLFDAGALEDGSPYLVMEYIDGTPLHEYCLRERPDAATRVRLMRDIAGAVEYAHRQGILHRDLKPGNILITASGTAKLLDFGVAKMFDTGPAVPPAHTAGLFRILTPEYASPEQLRGEPLDARSDVYALGLLLYETLTGQRPFAAAGRKAESILQAQRDPAWVRPSRGNPQVPTALDRVTRRALAFEPEARYSSAEALAEDLERWLNGKPVLAPAPRRLWPLAAAAVLALVVALVLWTRQPPPAPPRKLAVAGFRQLGGAAAPWLATAARELLQAEFASGSTLTSIAGDDADRARTLLGAPRAAAWLQTLGADDVIEGSVFSTDARPDALLRIDARLVDTRTGRTRATASETATVGELPALITRVAAVLSAPDRNRLGDGFRLAAEPLRLYAAALARLEAQDPLGARAELERAAAIEPEQPLVRWALARSLHALGYGRQARQQAEAALRYGARLTRTQRLRVEAFACRMQADTACAASRLQDLAASEPANMAVAADLALALNAAGRARDADTALARLPANHLERLAAEVTIAQSRGETDRQCQAAKALREAARAGGAAWLQAQAVHTLASCSLNVSDYRAAEQLLDEAAALYRERGYRLGVLRVEGTRAQMTMLRGQGEAAAAQHLRLASEARTIGQLDFEGQSLGNAAVAYVRLGDGRRALPLATRGAALLEPSSQRTHYGSMLNTLGAIYVLTGDNARAMESFRAAARLGEELHSPNLRQLGWFNAAAQALELGRFREFQEGIRKGAAAARITGWTGGAMATANGEAAIALIEGRLTEARTGFQNALALAEKMQELEGMAGARLSLAWIEVMEGRPQQAEPIARAILPRLSATGLAANASELWSVTAMAQAGRGQHRAARESLGKARLLLRRGSSRSARAFLLYAEAYAACRAGRRTEAARLLRPEVDRDAASGLGMLRWDAALLLAECEPDRARLEGIVRSARAEGFLRAADAAEAAIRRLGNE